MNMYTVGTVVEMSGFFEDLDGNRADPTFVRASIILPDGSLVSLTDGVQRRDTGDYFVLYVPPLSGLYQYRLIGYGAVAAANEGQWYAETSFPYDAINIPNTGELDMPEGDAPVVFQTFSVFCTPGVAVMNTVGRVPGTGKYEVVPDQGQLVADGQQPISDTLQSAQPNAGAIAFGGVQVVADLGARTGTAAIGMLGVAPTLTIVFNSVPLGGGMNLAGSTPVFSGQREATPNATVLTLVATAPLLNSGDNTAAGALALTGAVPGIMQNFTLGNTTTPGALTLAGNAPVLSVSQLVSTQAGSMAVTVGAAPTLSITSLRAVNAGALALTGNAPVVQYTASIAPDVGAMVITGGFATVRPSVMPTVGGLALTGIAGALVRGNVIAPSVGSLAAAGVAPTAVVSHDKITTLAGALALTGVAPSTTPIPIILQQKVSAAFGDGSSSAQITFDSPTTANSLFVVLLMTEHNIDATVITANVDTHSIGSMGTADIDVDASAKGVAGRCCAWSIKNTGGGGTDSITVDHHLATASYRSYFVAFELKNVDTTGSRVDATGSTTGNGAEPVSIAITTNTAHSIILSALACYPTPGAFVKDAGFDNINNLGVGYSLYDEFEWLADSGAAQARTLRYGTNTSVYYHAGIAIAYKPGS